MIGEGMGGAIIVREGMFRSHNCQGRNVEAGKKFEGTIIVGDDYCLERNIEEPLWLEGRNVEGPFSR